MHKYIVIVSPSYGGAEKRFFDIFTALVRRGESISLIAPSSLVERLRQDHTDRMDVLALVISVPVEPWGRLEFVRKFRRVLNGLPRGCHFHYPLNCLWPLHLLRRDTVSMSVADCTSVPSAGSSKRTSRWAWLSFFFVNRIDVLSPTVYFAMQRYLRFSSMHLTPGGTFLVPPSKTDCTRQPVVLFLGRLVPGKGLNDLFDVLPELWQKLQDRVPANFSFQIAGYGELESFVFERVEALKRSGIPIVFLGYSVADALLPRCSVLLSLQEPTNYPSRVVAEALIAGCSVVVRDTGDSRLFGSDLPGLQYCSASLDPSEMSEQIASLINLSLRNVDFSDRMSEAAMARFSSASYIDYFRGIMSSKPLCS